MKKKSCLALSLFASLLGSGSALACVDLSGTYLIPSAGVRGSFDGQRLIVEQTGCEGIRLTVRKSQDPERARESQLLASPMDGRSRDSVCELPGKRCELSQKAAWKKEGESLAATTKQVSKDEQWVEKTVYQYDVSLSPSGSLRVRYRFDWHQSKRHGFGFSSPEQKAMDIEEFEFRRVSR